MNKSCPLCLRKGKTSILRIYQINFDEATIMCEDFECPFPFIKGAKSIIFKRDSSIIKNFEASLKALTLFIENDKMSSNSLNGNVADINESTQISNDCDSIDHCISEMALEKDLEERLHKVCPENCPCSPESEKSNNSSITECIQEEQTNTIAPKNCHVNVCDDSASKLSDKLEGCGTYNEPIEASIIKGVENIKLNSVNELMTIREYESRTEENLVCKKTGNSGVGHITSTVQNPKSPLHTSEETVFSNDVQDNDSDNTENINCVNNLSNQNLTSNIGCILVKHSVSHHSENKLIDGSNMDNSVCNSNNDIMNIHKDNSTNVNSPCEPTNQCVEGSLHDEFNISNNSLKICVYNSSNKNLNTTINAELNTPESKLCGIKASKHFELDPPVFSNDHNYANDQPDNSTGTNICNSKKFNNFEFSEIIYKKKRKSVHVKLRKSRRKKGNLNAKNKAEGEQN